MTYIKHVDVILIYIEFTLKVIEITIFYNLYKTRRCQLKLQQKNIKLTQYSRRGAVSIKNY